MRRLVLAFKYRHGNHGHGIHSGLRGAKSAVQQLSASNGRCCLELDAAFFATVLDRSLAPERLAVLVSKHGSDASVIGVKDTPEALNSATTLTQAVLQQPAP